MALIELSNLKCISSYFVHRTLPFYIPNCCNKTAEEAHFKTQRVSFNFGAVLAINLTSFLLFVALFVNACCLSVCVYICNRSNVYFVLDL
jgi:hypothetical protein